MSATSALLLASVFTSTGSSASQITAGASDLAVSHTVRTSVIRTSGSARTWFDEQSCKPGSTQVYSPPAKEKSLLSSNIIDLAPAHNLSQGGMVSIAVVDSGVAAGNPALNGATIEAGYDATGGGNARADNEGHGTAVASIIVGQVNASGSILGVAPQATIIPVKVVNTEPRSSNEAEIAAYRAASVQYMANGISWAASNPSVDIIVVAASITTPDPRIEAAVSSAVSNNKVVIAAAGNAEKQSNDAQTTSADPQKDLRYPAAYPGVVGVTATDATGAIPEDSVLHTSAVDIAAPGMNVLVANGATGVCLTSTQAPSTSYATAYVGGAAALVRAYNNPSESAEMTAFRLLSSARRPSPSARDDRYGWGIVDPYRAMTLVDDGQLPGPDSPNRKRVAQKPTAGSDVPPAPHDFQRTGRTSGVIWLSAATGVIVVLLIFAAGRTRAARARGNDESADQ